MLSTLVKTGNISNLSDARYCSGMGVSLLGFNVNIGHPDYVSPQAFKAIKSWLAGVKTVAETDWLDAEKLSRILAEYEIDYIQAQEADWSGLPLAPVRFIARTAWHDIGTAQAFFALFKPVKEVLNFIQLDISQCKQPDAAPIREVCTAFRVLLEAPFTPEKAQVWLNHTSAAGIALHNESQEKTGFTNTRQLAQLLESLEIEE
jgi:phosphoribosylanthranilate isomerase